MENWGRCCHRNFFGGQTYGHAPSKTTARQIVGAVGMTVFQQHPLPLFPKRAGRVVLKLRQVFNCPPKLNYFPCPLVTVSGCDTV